MNTEALNDRYCIHTIAITYHGWLHQYRNLIYFVQNKFCVKYFYVKSFIQFAKLTALLEYLDLLQSLHVTKFLYDFCL